MRATILGLARDDISDPHIESRLEQASYPAIDATTYQRFDGTAIYAGEAAGRIDSQEESIYVTENGVYCEQEDANETVYCEWIADLSEGWVGVNRSSGEWLFDTLGVIKGTLFARAVIDVDGFASYVSDYPSADAWNVTQSRSLDPDDEAEETTISYHDAALLADTAGSQQTTMLGFSYHANGVYRRGVVTESGYVALFDGGDKASQYAEFLNSEILPFASLPEEYQGTFAGGEEADQETAAADGGDDV